jgi:hypothetical protein
MIMDNCSEIAVKEGPRHVQRVSAALFAVSLLVLSWFAPGGQVSRAILAFVAVSSVMLAVEITAHPRHRLSGLGRWRVYPLDAGAVLSSRMVWNVLLHALVAGAAFLTLEQTRHPDGAIASLLRLAAGVTLLYAVAALAFEILRFCFSVIGWSCPVIHRTPLAARSVAEFWGRRWNLLVSGWLHTFIFFPLVRRRRRSLGIYVLFL